MKKILTSTIFSLFIVLSLVSAQTTTNKEKKEISKTPSQILVATVNIYNATSQDLGNNSYKVSFQIHNRVGIQSDIRYGLELVNASTSEILDSKLENKSITLGENSSKDIEMTYTVPNFIPNGKYKLLIVAKNQNGLPLAYLPAGFPERIITVNESLYSLNIEKCTLKINEDASTTAIHTNTEGVNILSSQSIMATCIISNNGKINVGDLKVSLITHEKDEFGDILREDVIDQRIDIKSESSQTVIFELPTMQKAESYSIDTFLINASKVKVSPSNSINYTVIGNNATIKNAILDKTSYKKDDIAEIVLFWTSNTNNDNKTKAIYNAIVEIRDNTGKICGNVSENISNDQALNVNNIKVTLNKDCNNALANIQIVDENGVILDSTQININNPTQIINIDTDGNNLLSRLGNINKIYIIVFLIVISMIGYGILRLRKNN